MSAQSSRLPAGFARAQAAPSPTRFVRLAELRRRRGSEQVAAVCYRVRGGAIEFLLVQTRGQRWTFPKGSVEAGLTHAQSAALEAFEEAGVHGRMEELSFAQYVRRKGGDPDDPDCIEVVVNVHLCEVLRLSGAHEPGRNPSWFPVEKARRRLKQDRADVVAEELLRVLEEALVRIQQIHNRSRATALALRRAPFTVIEGRR